MTSERNLLGVVVGGFGKAASSGYQNVYYGKVEVEIKTSQSAGRHMYT